MNRRERLGRKLEKRQEWAVKASGRSDAAYAASTRIADGIPLGQPILIGHHSEKRARRDQARIHSAMSRSVEQQKLAAHHVSKAAGLEAQLESHIFSDDEDAIERLEQKIAELEALCDKLTAANRAWRKGGRQELETQFGVALAAAAAKVMGQGYSWIRSPFNLTSDRAEIRRCRARIEHIRKMRARTEEAESAGGVVVRGNDNWCIVTFADKPDRMILGELKRAGFRWGSGSWHGLRENLPASVAALGTAGSSAVGSESSAEAAE